MENLKNFIDRLQALKVVLDGSFSKYTLTIPVVQIRAEVSEPTLYYADKLGIPSENNQLCIDLEEPADFDKITIQFQELFAALEKYAQTTPIPPKSSSK